MVAKAVENATVNVRRQFSFASIWDRTMRVIGVGAAYIVGAGWQPHNPVWWAAGVGSLAAASYTGKGQGARDGV